MAASSRNPRRQLKSICQSRVKLCRVALTSNGDANCIFAGRVDVGQKGDETAVALGQNGSVVTCEIFAKHELSIRPLQRHTTLLHLLCQFRLQLLLFLFEKMHKKSGHYARVPRLIEQANFGEVVKLILGRFPGLDKVLDHAEMMPLSRLIQSMSTHDCLLNWLPVFETLVKLKVDAEPSEADQFIRSVIDKLCLVEYPTRNCGSDCSCETEIFNTLLMINRGIKMFTFRTAARNGNFHLMDLFIKQHFANSPNSFVTPHVLSDRGGPNASEPIIVYILKSEFCRRWLSENQLVYLLDLLAKLNRIDINEPDADGFNALFYAANFKLRKPFNLLLNHNKFNCGWRNADGDLLEDLFCWSGLDQTNHAATLALRRKTRPRVDEMDTLPRRLLSCPSSGSTFTGDLQQLDTSTLDSETERENFERSIRRNFRRLCKDMEPDGQLLDVLVEEDVLCLAKLDSFASLKTRHDKVRKVLTLVIRSGRKGRLAFLKGLRYSHQQHLLDVLKSSSLPSLSGSSMDLPQDSSVEYGRDEVATNPSLPAAEEMSFEVNRIYANGACSSLENGGAISDQDSFRSDSFEECEQKILVTV